MDSWLAYRDFRLLWFANFCAFTGQWLQLLSIGWLVKELSAGSGAGGLLVLSASALNTLPGLVVNPLTGVLGDRLDRRKLAIVVQSIAAALALGFAFLVDTDHIRYWHAYAYVLISGSCLAITQPIQQVMISNTVPRGALTNAYAINTLTVTGTRIFGPFVGGILIASIGFFWNFAMEAALYLGVVLMLIPMRTPYTSSALTSDETAGQRQRITPIADIRDGLRHLWRQQKEVLEIALISVIPNTILHPLWFLLPLFTVEVLQAHADMGGYLLAVTGVGGLISTLCIATWGFPFRRGHILIATCILGSLSTMLFSQCSWLWAAFIVLAVMSFFQAYFRTTAGTLVLTIVPDQYRARTMALLAYERSSLIGVSILVGLLADFTSASMAILAIGALGLSLTLACFATLRRVRALQ
ncbi:MAG: MFS transporter [Chloroflexi bacterium]|nr:MFS transporter [Chloroflexota bacterium]